MFGCWLVLFWVVVSGCVGVDCDVWFDCYRLLGAGCSGLFGFGVDCV